MPDDYRLLVASAERYTAAGYPLIPLTPGTKQAAHKGWRSSTVLDPSSLQKFVQSCRGQFAVALPAERMVIDIDPRHFQAGDKPLTRLLKVVGVGEHELLGLSAVVRTGSGGYHLYLAAPQLPPNTRLRHKFKEYPGLDFMTQGRYVLAAGVEHPETKQRYRWLATGTALEGVGQAPEPLIRFLSVTTEPTLDGGSGAAVRTDDPGVVSRYREYLERVTPPPEGQINNETFAVAAKGRDLGLTPEIIYTQLLEVYNPRLPVQWDESGLRQLVVNSDRYARDTPGCSLPQSQFKEIKTPVSVGKPAVRWDRTSSGQLRITMNNCVNFFADPRWGLSECIGFNEFSGRVTILKQLPWHPQDSLPREWADRDTAGLALHMSKECKFHANTSVLETGLMAASQRFKFHPLRDYLNGLKWDGTQRVETFLIDHAGVIDTKYTRAVSRLFLLQAVYRAMMPGCKADYIVVFESGQGKGKTQLLEVLGNEWYADIIIDTHSKDTVDAMQGKWIVEMAEMEVTRRAEAAALKAFISRRTDRVRLAYGRHSVNLPRSCVFSGTINPDALGSYLSDDTGNRRFLPLVVRKIHLDKIKAIRDQLFAEAMTMYRAKEQAWVDDPVVEKQIQKEQDDRQAEDSWQSRIQTYLDREKPPVVKTEDIWIYALHGSYDRFHIVQQRRISTCLKKAGYERKTRRVSGVLAKVFVRPEQLS